MLSKKIVLAFASFAVCASCHPRSKDEQMTRQQERNLAENLPLHERYQLYQSVFDRVRPPDVSLADEVAELGEPAFMLAVNKAKTGTANEIDAAIEVIGITVRDGTRECSSKDLSDISANVRDKFKNRATARTVYRRVAFACSVRDRRNGSQIYSAR